MYQSYSFSSKIHSDLSNSSFNANILSPMIRMAHYHYIVLYEVIWLLADKVHVDKKLPTANKISNYLQLIALFSFIPFFIGFLRLIESPYEIVVMEMLYIYDFLV